MFFFCVNFNLKGRDAFTYKDSHSWSVLIVERTFARLIFILSTFTIIIKIVFSKNTIKKSTV